MLLRRNHGVKRLRIKKEKDYSERKTTNAVYNIKKNTLTSQKKNKQTNKFKKSPKIIKKTQHTLFQIHFWINQFDDITTLEAEQS